MTEFFKGDVVRSAYTYTIINMDNPRNIIAKNHLGETCYFEIDDIELISRPEPEFGSRWKINKENVNGWYEPWLSSTWFYVGNNKMMSDASKLVHGDYSDIIELKPFVRDHMDPE